MNMRGSTIKRAAIAILGGIALLMATEQAQAQRFEELFGGSCGEGGYAGVRSTVNGGYISVGNTTQRGLSCRLGSSDLYVVRLRDNGTLLWAKTYQIGNSSIAYSVVECSNGDFAITGAADNASSLCGGSRDLFILRISNAGAVVWSNIYTTSTGGSSTGYRIIEAKQGPGVQGSGLPAPGDLVVAGQTSTGATAPGDACLLRADASGNLIWAKRYSSGKGDFFRGLVEAQVGMGSAGDIIAVGGTEGWNPVSNIVDGFIVRVSGNNGTIGLAPQGIATYTNGANNVQINGVDEIPSGTSAGDLVYTGDIANGSDRNIYVLHTAANPCTYLLDASYGNPSGTDFGTSIRVVSGSGLNNGDLVISSVTHMRGVVNADVGLAELDPTTLALVTPTTIPAGAGFRIYGSLFEEDGQDVAVVPASAGSRTAGFYLTGLALGSTTVPCLPPPSDPSQMYVIKTDNLGRSNCHDSLVSPMQNLPALTENCRSLTPSNFSSRCTTSVITSNLTTMDTLCNDSLHDAPPSNGTHLSGSDGDEGRTAGVESAAMTLDQQVSFLPNPVRRGERCTVTLRQSGSGTAMIAVTDISGHLLSKREEAFSPGATLFGIETGGWSPGTYLVTVTVGGQSVTKSVVLLD